MSRNAWIYFTRFSLGLSGSGFALAALHLDDLEPYPKGAVMAFLGMVLVIIGVWQARKSS